ncbi:hypothetical protein [Luteibacter sp. 9135]|uniref:hypothetical protein n=1 Tax=Luteibacter sp. 9135 TaxID=1500893 RepID=UPI00056A7187|nr:hypothetical protein [Luteibacter sp. 9135]
MSHEPQNLSARRIAIAGASLALAVLVVLAICHVMAAQWASSPEALASLPPQPRLQALPGRDLAGQRDAAAQRDGWAWQDPEHRVARVPVERAMRIMASDAAR